MFTEDGRKMSLNEFKDRLFDLLNETDCLPIADLEVQDTMDVIKVCLTDKSAFKIKCSRYKD